MNVAEQTVSFRVGLELTKLQNHTSSNWSQLKVWSLCHVQRAANHTEHAEHQFDSLLMRLRGCYEKYPEIKCIYKAGIKPAEKAAVSMQVI